MLDEALRKLQLDRRLLERRGWITRSELARAIADLPDVADKAAPPEPAAGDAGSGEAD